MNRRTFLQAASLVLAIVALGSVDVARAGDGKIRPFVLGRPFEGDMNAVVGAVKEALKGQGFQIVGAYVPYKGATVICATSGELKSAAARAKNGGFGAATRVAVTELNGKVQVSYANPTYVGTAYGMGKLEGVATKLATALGAVRSFGAMGLSPEQVKAGTYKYTPFMESFYDTVELKEFADHATAVATVEKNLQAKKGGTMKVYRIDIPGKSMTVFGVGINKGDGVGSGAKDTDKEIMSIIDFQDPRSTAYLPYEILVTGDKAIMLHARFRIAVHFPDTTMVGAHGFTAIMSAPDGIQKALEALTEI